MDPQRLKSFIYLFFALISALALLSFDPFDPSVLSFGDVNSPPNNAIGIIGSYFSHISILSIGWLSYLIPSILGYMAYAQSRNITFSKVNGICLLILTFVSSTIGLEYYYPQTFHNDISFQSSGFVGHHLNFFLLKYLGFVGTGIMLLLLTLFVLGSNLKKALALNRHRPIVVPQVMEIPVRTSPTKILKERFSFSKSTKKALCKLPVDPIVSDTYSTQPLENLFATDAPKKARLSNSEYQATAESLVKTFQDFGISGHIDGIQPGPVVTVFEFIPDAGTKISKILGLIDDIALALKVDSILMQAVPGKRAIGVQVPNKNREVVHFGDLLKSQVFRDSSSALTLALGKSISGEPVVADLCKMPHLLLAGATGSGKSVAINALLCSVIMKSSPQDVRMILVDPKMLELSVYAGIPHLLMPVITEPEKASFALKWAVKEMEDRYRLMQHAKVRNISGFNEFWRNADTTSRQDILELTGLSQISELPLILFVIDELADLMMTAPKDVESYVQRLAQKARASGIHLILATQRPSVDIITGVIKANLPSRIAFQVVSKHDSRTILDQMGADKLLGHGDMLFQQPGVGKLQRIQGSFISDAEVNQLVAALKKDNPTQFDQSIMQWIDQETSRGGVETEDFDDVDPKYSEAIAIASKTGAISASYLQRQLKIGYNRAARMIESMEAHGLVDKAETAGKPRRWLGNV